MDYGHSVLVLKKRDIKFKMKVNFLLKTFCLLSLGFVLHLTANAGESNHNSVPFPDPPKAKENFSTEQACVEPIEVIRRNHGHFLKHHRDDTMHHGIRTPQHSLVACINCHVVPNSAGHYPTLEGTDHFCRNCHAYAAVTIDCFQCHASQPEKAQTVSTMNTLKLDTLGTPNTLSE